MRWTKVNLNGNTTHTYTHTLANAAIKITRHPEILCCQINCWQPSAARENQGCCRDRERARHFWWTNKYRKHDYIIKQDKTSTATSKPKHSHTTYTVPNAAIQITGCTQLNLNGFTPHTLPNAAIKITRHPEILWRQIRVDSQVQQEKTKVVAQTETHCRMRL